MSRRRDMVRVENAASKIYVGNLGDYGDKAELERAFEKYGEVISVWSRVAKSISGAFRCFSFVHKISTYHFSAVLSYFQSRITEIYGAKSLGFFRFVRGRPLAHCCA